MSSRRFRTTLDGRVLQIEVDGDTARVHQDETPEATPDAPSATTPAVTAQAFTIAPIDAATVRVQAENTPIGRSAITAIDSGSAGGRESGIVWTFIDGEVFRVDVEDADRVTTRRGPGDEALSAPMPATVIKLLVEPGATVAQGDTLLLLEAMKMELPIRAPRAGRVTAFHCKAGELVQPGVPLVSLEESA
jgi:biotin carboxyl carrier protein